MPSRSCIVHFLVFYRCAYVKPTLAQLLYQCRLRTDPALSADASTFVSSRTLPTGCEATCHIRVTHEIAASTLVVTLTAPPQNSSKVDSADEASKRSSLNAGAAAGIAIASLCAGLLLSVAIFFIRKRRRRETPSIGTHMLLEPSAFDGECIDWIRGFSFVRVVSEYVCHHPTAS